MIEGDKPTFNPYFYGPKYPSSDALPAPEIFNFFSMAGSPMKFVEMPTSEECGGVRSPHTPFTMSLWGAGEMTLSNLICGKKFVFDVSRPFTVRIAIQRPDPKKIGIERG